MPIKFRCPSCNVKLSVTSRKAGQDVTCPQCQKQVTVPTLEAAPESIPAPPVTSATSTQASATPTTSPPKRTVTRPDPPKSPPAYEDNLDPFANEASLDLLRSLGGDGPDAAPAHQTSDEQADPSPAGTNDDYLNEGFDDLPALPDRVIQKPREQAHAAAPSPPPVEIRHDEQQDALDELLEEQLPPEPLTQTAPSKKLVRRYRASDDEEEFVMRRPNTTFEEMDLTPMVDVTFLLLIFFMVTASFSLQKTMQIPPPERKDEGLSQTQVVIEDFEDTSILVEIDSRNIIYVEEEPLRDVRDLVPRLEQLIRSEKKNEVIITPAPESFHETVVSVLDAANEAGMQRIRLGAKKGDL